MPCNEDFFNAMGGRYGLGNKYMLCNGPFYVSAWDPETSMTIKANKFYSGASKAKPSSVIFSFDPSAESISKKLTAGSLGAAFLSPDAPQPENTVTVSESVNSSFGFIFNCANALMGNKELRLALCSSIDRNLFSSKGSNIAPQSGLVREAARRAESTTVNLSAVRPPQFSMTLPPLRHIGKAPFLSSARIN